MDNIVYFFHNNKWNLSQYFDKKIRKFLHLRVSIHIIIIMSVLIIIKPHIRVHQKSKVQCHFYFLLFPPAKIEAILMKMLMVSM